MAPVEQAARRTASRAAPLHALQLPRHAPHVRSEPILLRPSRYPHRMRLSLRPTLRASGLLFGAAWCTLLALACSGSQQPSGSEPQLTSGPEASEPESTQLAHNEPAPPQTIGPETLDECRALMPNCTRLELRTHSICYGTAPGPSAPRSEHACVCHDCDTDADCSPKAPPSKAFGPPEKRTIACREVSSTCGPGGRTCLSACDEGRCGNREQCADGLCWPVEQRPP